jgi:hypothetical protein
MEERKKVPSRGSKKGERRGGRKKGTPNKITAELKDMIRAALDEAGGVDYLKKQALEEPAAFLSLLGKTLPKEVTGAGGKPLIPPSSLPGALKQMSEAELLVIASGNKVTVEKK